METTKIDNGTEHSYAEGCVLALLRTIHPDAGHGLKAFRYEVQPGDPAEVIDFYGEPGTDVSAWRHSPGTGWRYAVRPFDIVQPEHQARVRAGEVEWHLASAAGVEVERFVAEALDIIADHSPAVRVWDRLTYTGTDEDNAREWELIHARDSQFPGFTPEQRSAVNHSTTVCEVCEQRTPVAVRCHECGDWLNKHANPDIEQAKRDILAADALVAASVVTA